MKSYSGKSECPVHGEFEWRFTELSPGELVTGAWDALNLNCNQRTLEGDIYQVETKCPECAKRIFVEVPKKD